MRQKRDKQSFSSSIRQGIGGTFIAQLSKLVLFAVTLPILARTLSPSNFGYFAIIFAIYLVLDLLRDFGLSIAQIGKKKISFSERNSYFWISIVCSLIMYCFSLLVFKIIQNSLTLPDQIFQSAILSLGLLFNGFSSQFLLDLRFKLRFREIALIEISSNLLGSLAAIYFALCNFGVWALVSQQLISTIVIALLSYCISDFRPTAPSNLAINFNLIKSGLWISASQFVDILSKSLVTLQLGRELPLSDVGLYDRAQQLQNIPNNSLGVPVRNFSLPILRKVINEAEKLEELMIKWQLPLLHISLFIYSLLFINARGIISLIYGENYFSAVPIFRLLLIIGMIQSASHMGIWVTLLSNLSRTNLYLSITNLFIVLISVQVGLRFGIYEAIIGLLLANTLKFVTIYFVAKIISEISVGKICLGSIKLLVPYVLFNLIFSYLSSSLSQDFAPAISFLASLIFLTMFTMYLLSMSRVLDVEGKRDIYIIFSFFFHKIYK
jgi:PST family polysaccharide transporter